MFWYKFQFSILKFTSKNSKPDQQKLIIGTKKVVQFRHIYLGPYYSGFFDIYHTQGINKK